MPEVLNPNFSNNQFSDKESWQKVNALPKDFKVERAQTQINVNATVLNFLVQKFNKEAPLNILDLPSGRLEFSRYVKQLFPLANITAVDIVPQPAPTDIHFHQMDVSKEFTLPQEEKYDLITSVSGVMMFSNTKHFLESCIKRLKPGGTFLLTNDSATTVLDKINFLLFGSLRIFPPVFDDGETLTENVPIQELCRIMRVNNMKIKDIVYTSYTSKDLLFLPLCLLLFPFHLWKLGRQHTNIPKHLIKKMYPFKHLYCRHYIMIAEK